MEVPVYYIVRRGLDPDELQKVQAALSLTPCQAAFISNLQDHEFALKFSDQIICTESENKSLELANEWAKRIGRPMLAVTNCSENLFAVQEDGTLATVCQREESPV